MNLRDPTDTTGYPARDEIPSQLLNDARAPTHSHYEARCSAFFAAIFQVLQNKIASTPRPVVSEKLWTSWVNLFRNPVGKERGHFFHLVKKAFEKVGFTVLYHACP